MISEMTTRSGDDRFDSIMEQIAAHLEFTQTCSPPMIDLIEMQMIAQAMRENPTPGADALLITNSMQASPITTEDGAHIVGFLVWRTGHPVMFSSCLQRQETDHE